MSFFLEFSYFSEHLLLERKCACGFRQNSYLEGRRIVRTITKVTCHLLATWFGHLAGSYRAIIQKFILLNCESLSLYLTLDFKSRVMIFKTNTTTATYSRWPHVNGNSYDIIIEPGHALVYRNYVRWFDTPGRDSEGNKVYIQFKLLPDDVSKAKRIEIAKNLLDVVDNATYFMFNKVPFFGRVLRKALISISTKQLKNYLDSININNASFYNISDPDNPTKAFERLMIMKSDLQTFKTKD